MSCTVSMLIVVRNGEKHITNCLESVLAQDIGQRDAEVLVVDGMSTDNTVALAEALLSGSGIRYRIIPNEKHSLAAGWNIAIAESAGKYVIRTDVHAGLMPDYVRLGIQKLEQNPTLAAVGGVLETKSDTPIGNLIATALSNPVGVGNSSFRIGLKTDSITDTAVFAVYRRDVFDEVGLFNEHLDRNQDIEFHSRVVDAGYDLLTSPELQASYFSRATLRGFLTQAARNGYWVIRSGKYRARHLAPLVFTLLLISLAVLNPFCLAGLMALYISAVLLAYASLSRVYSPHSLLLLTGLTFALHLAYGLGSICGLIWRLLRYRPDPCRNS